MKYLLPYSTIIILFLTSCSEKTSTNPYEVYQLWTGNKPTNGIKVNNGKYWESAHWTREYKLFIELETDLQFWTLFKKQNDLLLDTTSIEFPISDKPEWFTPSKHSVKY